MLDRANNKKQERVVTNTFASFKDSISVKTKFDYLAGCVDFGLIHLSAGKLTVYSNTYNELAQTHFDVNTGECDEEKPQRMHMGQNSAERESYWFTLFPRIEFTDILSFLQVKNSGNLLNHPSLANMRYATMLPDQEHLVLWGANRYSRLNIAIVNLISSTAFHHRLNLFFDNGAVYQIFPASNEHFFIQRYRWNAYFDREELQLYALHFDFTGETPHYRTTPRLSAGVSDSHRHISMTLSPDKHWLATIDPLADSFSSYSALYISPYNTQTCLTDAYIVKTGYDILVRSDRLSGKWLPNSAGYIYQSIDGSGYSHSVYLDINNLTGIKLHGTASLFSIPKDNGRIWLLDMQNQTLDAYPAENTSIEKLRSSLYTQPAILPTVLIDIILTYVGEHQYFNTPTFSPTQRLPKSLQAEMKSLMEKYTRNETEYKNNISTLTYFNNLSKSKPEKTLPELVKLTKKTQWNFFRPKHRHPCKRFFKAVLQTKATFQEHGDLPPRLR